MGNRLNEIEQMKLEKYYKDWSIKKYGSYKPIYWVTLINESENYDEYIVLLRDIINSGDDRLKGYLSNTINIWDYYNYLKYDDKYSSVGDFIDLQRRLNKEYLSPERVNINDSPIIGNRIQLVKNNQEYDDVFINEYSKDDAFEMFTNIEPSEFAYKYYSPKEGMFSFVILDNISKNPLGYVQLYNLNENAKTIELTYYIFKEHRNKGIGKEAVSLLIHSALNNELECLSSTIYKNHNDKKIVNIELIYAYTNVNNTGSIKLLESLGFERSGIMHRYEAIRENEYIDCYRYELIKE